MSHFNVLVVTDRSDDDAITQALVPFQEHAENNEPDPETGNCSYQENPNEKWDWWQVGGRWSNALVCKRDTGLYRTDQCRVGDLDFESMCSMRVERAVKSWYTAQAEKAKLEAEGNASDGTMEIFYGIMPGVTKDEYIAQRSKFATFAVLMDGKWYEKGQMGWWGVVSYPDGSVGTSATQSDEWQTKFDEMLQNLDPNKYVTVVDCHI
jgi:hypothetical protein